MIADMIPERVAYTQLAEECTELAHAALKQGRFADEQQVYTMGDADREKWFGNLYEEMADVLVCMGVTMNYLPKGAWDAVEKIKKQKIERWNERLKGGRE